MYVRKRSSFWCSTRLPYLEQPASSYSLEFLRFPKNLAISHLVDVFRFGVSIPYPVYVSRILLCIPYPVYVSRILWLYPYPLLAAAIVKSALG